MSGRIGVSIDLVLVAYRDRKLHVRVQSEEKKAFILPWGPRGRGESLDQGANRIAKGTLGAAPGWIEQIGAFSEGTSHPGGSALSVCYAGVVPWSASPAWKEIAGLSLASDRQRHMVSATLSALRHRLEQTPIVFSLLPREFTLSELQQAYETLLARRLHKASFRRALQAAFLVHPTGEWRSEGRGRPAQLFRYAPKKRAKQRRGVRLDLL